MGRTLRVGLPGPLMVFAILLIAGLSECRMLGDVKHRPQAEANPVLTTLAADPDLTDFYSLFNSTGGDSGEPGPGFEERFNNPANGLKYTVFAPTNEAIRKIPQSIRDDLIRPSSFELLSTILRNHIALGELGGEEVAANKILRFVGGFSIKFTASLAIETNPDLTKGDTPAHPAANVIKDKSGQPARLQASNGAVYKLDSLLDEFGTYFGVDAPGKYYSPPPVQKQSGTMASILNTTAELSQLNALWQKLNPDFLTRLELGSDAPGGDDKTVYLAPSNAAFDALPGPGRAKAMQASNFGTTSFLLGHGLGSYDQKARVVKSVNGFDIQIHGGLANNARIEKRICGENGCVWIVGRWLDPIFFLQ